MYSSLNHNLVSSIVASNLICHYSALTASTQRLASGLRINSAVDDAAGLCIRELMRSDIAGLRQGMRNASDAISLIQVADGALAVIDEKLIRMKELAEQAATGTYNSIQRLLIDSEFQAMASEIDRIARATDYNGIHLLDGSLQGDHNASLLRATGKMKIHFGSGNDSAEDYYYIEIADCTTKGLGLSDKKEIVPPAANHGVAVAPAGATTITLNDLQMWPQGNNSIDNVPGHILDLADVLDKNGEWITGTGQWREGVMIFIPKGSKNVIINMVGAGGRTTTSAGDNDIQLFTKNGVHLAGTPLDDAVYARSSLEQNSQFMGFTRDQYDDTCLNSGPASGYDLNSLNYSTYNGMVIGYSGDSERIDSNPNNLIMEDDWDYEILTIDEATEDLIVWFPGAGPVAFKSYGEAPRIDHNSTAQTIDTIIDIKTQEKAEKALIRINDTLEIKDKIRANLGAIQNRLENTFSNISIQAENLLASESRISDVDVAIEMTKLVRNQILAQSGIAMLAQANNAPQMLTKLISSSGIF